MTFSAPSSPPPGRHNKAVIMNAARRAGRCRNHTGKSESLSASCLSLSHIVLPWAPAAAAQDLACGRTGRLAVVVFDLPIDDREVDAFRQLIRFDKGGVVDDRCRIRSEEHTSELQSRLHLVCRLLLEKKKMESMTHVSL